MPGRLPRTEGAGTARRTMWREGIANIGRRLDRAPMVKALVPLACGILLAGRWSLPLWGVAAGLVVSLATGLLLRRGAAGSLCMAAAMLLAGWCAVEVRPQRPLPTGCELLMEISADNVVSRRDGQTVAEGRVISFERAGRVELCGAAVRIVAAEEVALREGERLEALCRVSPFAGEGFGRYMSRRGFAGQIRLYASQVTERRDMPLPWVRRLRDGAVERIRRLGLPVQADVVVRAMTVGDRSDITPAMRRQYALGGVSHLLAVSGLHVGFVFVVVNLLLFWVPVLRYGYSWRCLLAVAAIWLYAAVTGLPPSVVRAAAMFSVFQTAMAVTVRFDSLNSLCLTACLMLLFDAPTFYDVGFRLSFLSVAAIIEWGVPLYRRTTYRPVPSCFEIPRGFRENAVHYLKVWSRRCVCWVWGGVLMGAAANVATMPLSSYLFGTVSLWSVVAGPAAVLLSGISVGAAFLWTLLPLPFLQPLAAWVTGTAAGLLGRLVEACSRSGSLAFDATADGVVVAAAYIAMALFTLWLWSRRSRRRRDF